MIKQEEKQTIQEWIQKILQEAGKSQERETHPVDAGDKTCMDIHKDILLLEGDFQTNLHRWQDEQSVDLSHISNLRQPLDTIISLFESFHIPNHASGSGEEKEAMPVFHVETTLSILQSLLGRYDSTLSALSKARDAVSRIDARQVINNQRVSEWTSRTLNTLHDSRTALLSQHHRSHHQQSERDVLKSRLQRYERETKTSENLIVSLVSKLNEAEESVIVYQQDIKKLQSKVLSLQTHIQQITKWKEHVRGVGVTSELRSRSRPDQKELTGSREKALEYSKRQAAKKVIEQGERSSRTRSHSKSRESRPTSRQSSRSRARSRSATSDRQLKSEKDELEESYALKLFEAVSPALKKSILKAKSSPAYQPMYPAQQILLSKLRDVDGEINELARDLMFY